MRSRSERHKLNSPPELDDADWLRAQYRTKPASRIAAELGVSKPLAHKAMRQLGIEADGPWVRRDNTRLTPPRPEMLADAWDADPTVKGIARRLGVSPTTAAVWLADGGIFVKDTPAISRRDLAAEIDAGQPIEQIARKHRVAPSTVAIELRRHGLREAHRHRPRPTGGS